MEPDINNLSPAELRRLASERLLQITVGEMCVWYYLICY